MDPEEIRDVCIRAADDMLAYSRLFGASETAVKVRSYTVAPDGQVHLKLDSRIGDTGGTVLRAGEDVFTQDCFAFTYSDPRLKSAGIRFIQGRVEAILKGHPDLELVSDLSFLIRSARDWYDRYGGLIGYPLASHAFGDGEFRFPSGSVPSERQREAVRTILNSGMSYIWGAPGTGKTQMVLATAVMAHMARGSRVAVIAPTNNAVEQVIRGLASAVRSDPGFRALLDPEREIARIGTPTPGFMEEHPGMCEKRALDEAMRAVRRDRDAADAVLAARRLERARPFISEYLEQSGGGGPGGAPDLLARALAELGDAESLADIADALLSGDPEGIAASVGRADACGLLQRYSDLSDGELLDILDGSGSAAAEPADPEHCRIVACTPQAFMSRFVPNGAAGDRPPFDVDHVFIDEAGYCSCFLALAVLANRVPVTLLGDHKQLPPVCAVDDEALRGYISRGGFMRYGFLMSQSALFIESMLTGSAESASDAFVRILDPVFTRTRRADLTESHRFGPNLGAVLDRYVYRNGIVGAGRSPLEIVCIDVRCGPRDRRCNIPEAEAVRDYLEAEAPDDYCVLSPYRTQVDAIRRLVPGEDERISTVHRSQGREWDTVILSVQDGSGCDRDVPLRFTSSSTDIGLKVVNTAVSRAKRRLVVVCDYGFWHSRTDELIGGLVGSPGCRVIQFEPHVSAPTKKCK